MAGRIGTLPGSLGWCRQHMPRFREVCQTNADRKHLTRTPERLEQRASIRPQGDQRIDARGSTRGNPRGGGRNGGEDGHGDRQALPVVDADAEEQTSNRSGHQPGGRKSNDRAAGCEDCGFSEDGSNQDRWRRAKRKSNAELFRPPAHGARHQPNRPTEQSTRARTPNVSESIANVRSLPIARSICSLMGRTSKTGT